MALSDLVEGTGGWGLGIGLLAGAAILASRQGRPLVKGALVGYFTLTDRAKTLAAEASEQLQDLYAEARAEYIEGAAAGDEMEIVDVVDVVDDEPPPPPPKRPRAGRGRKAPAAK